MKTNLFKKISKALVVGLIMLVFLILPNRLLAQLSFEITPSYGYLVSTNVRTTEGDLVVKDSPNYGLTLDIGHHNVQGAKLQLMYNRQNTRMELKEYPSGARRELFDVIVEYWQIGVVREVPMQSKKFTPYGVVGLGAANFNPVGSMWSDEWFFAAHFGGGLKMFFSDAIGIRLQARALFPFSFSGGSLWCGTGGCSVGIGSYTSLMQFDFTAGLIIALGTK